MLISSQLSAQETVFENDDDSMFYHNPPLPVNIPFNQTLIINISNPYENKSYKFIR